MRKTAIASLVMLAGAMATADAASLSVSFGWGNTPACGSGNPSVVASPAFKVGGVPKGTKSLRFLMTDLDARGYHHGGGTAPYSGKSSVPAGAFRYKGPCPPGGAHTYQWSVEAMDAGGKVLATGSARKRFP
jgi:phosphatidylethanolamine-binding protein (PEBP) family uncharacterized protein